MHGAYKLSDPCEGDIDGCMSNGSDIAMTGELVEDHYACHVHEVVLCVVLQYNLMSCTHACMSEGVIIKNVTVNVHQIQTLLLFNLYTNVRQSRDV